MVSDAVKLTKPSTSDLVVTHCGDYTVNGETFTASGTYVQHILNVGGCDSTISLDLTILEPSSSSITETACKSYTVNGQTFTESGVYTQHILNKVGCDSTITLNLTIGNPYRDTLRVTAQNAYTWNSKIFTLSGLYVDTFKTKTGCDSIICIQLTVKQTQEISLVKGWNLISFSVHPTDISIEAIISQIKDKIIEVKSTDAFYRTLQVAAFNSLTTLAAGEAYWVLANDNTDLYVDGEAVAPSVNYSVKEGWNIVGCQFLEPMLVEAAFANIIDKITVIKDFDAFWTPGSSFMIKPTKGYFVKIKQQ